MFSTINKRLQREICFVLHLVFLTNHCIAFKSTKSIDLNPDKYEDTYDEDKLESNVWMNMFGTYPTIHEDNVKGRKQNVTRDKFYDKNMETIEQFFNEQNRIQKDDKLIEMSISKFMDEKTIDKMVEDTPLYQLCLETVNVPEVCLALILKNNIRKISANKKQFCGILPSAIEYHQCIQLFQLGDDYFNSFLRKNIFIPLVKKNKSSSDTPKRLPFHAWGGKRLNQVGTEKIQTSRVPFNAWGGKRTEFSNNNFEELCEPCKRSKAKFHSWGGKRSKRKVAM